MSTAFEPTMAYRRLSARVTARAHTCTSGQVRRPRPALGKRVALVVCICGALRGFEDDEAGQCQRCGRPIDGPAIATSGGAR